MEDQIWSLEKNRMKNSYNNKKKSYIIKIFLFEYKFVFIE